MRISQSHLRQIIREELSRLSETDQGADRTLFKRASDLSRRAGLFIKNVDTLKRNYPEEYSTLTSAHPKFVENEQRVRKVLRDIESSVLAGAALVTAIDTYNNSAADINTALDSVTGELKLTPEQSEEIAQVANDVYDSMFPETYVSQFVRWTTGQDKLENYQKWLLLPGEGIESAVTNVFSLFKPETWTSAAAGVETLYEMTPEERSAVALAIKSAWDQIPAQRLTRDFIRWLLSVIFLCGGILKMLRLTGLVLAPRTIELLYLLRNLSKLKALPIAVLEGLRLTPV